MSKKERMICFMYIKPIVIVVNLADDESLVAMARCSGNYSNVETCS